MYLTLLWLRFFLEILNQTHGTYLVNYSRHFSWSCSIHTLILLSRSILKIKAWLSSADETPLISYSWDSLSITDQRRSTCKNKNTQVFLVSVTGTAAFQSRRKRAPILHSRSRCNLHNDSDEQPIRGRFERKSLQILLQMHVDCVYSWQLGWWGCNMEEAGWTLVMCYR